MDYRFTNCMAADRTVIVSSAGGTTRTTLADVRFVQFGIMSPEEIIKSGVLPITKVYSNGGPTDGTVYDERMGVVDMNRECKTCGRKLMECPGHFGYVNLVEPVFNPLMMPHVEALLKCVCNKCSAPRISKDKAELQGLLKLKCNARLRGFAKNYSKVNVCPGCHALLPTYNTRDGLTMVYTVGGGAADGDEEKHHPMSAADVYAIFERITDETMDLLGFNDGLSLNPLYTDPEVLGEDRTHAHCVKATSLLFTVFPVLPPCCRPPAYNNGEKCNDHLTELYNSLVRTNERIRESREGIVKPTKRRPDGKLTELELRKALKDLEINVHTIVDNHKEKGTAHAAKGIRERLEGKYGRAQGNVVSKRTDQSARTVIIGGGLHIKVGEVGVPEKIARTLTRPEMTNSFNKDWLQTLVNEGRANYIIRRGQRIVLDVVTAGFTKPFPLQLGDVVERHLMDGDPVIFNRQPTIRIESMQGMKARIIRAPLIPGTRKIDMRRSVNAFMLPLAVTRAYNADFDGDEMNLHAVQKLGAMAEVLHVMSTAYHIITPQRNGPVCGIVQDGLTWSYILTRFPTQVKWGIFFDVVMQSSLEEGLPDFMIRAHKYYPEYVSSSGQYIGDTMPGKLLISIVFPHDLVYSNHGVVIEQGILLPTSAALDAKTLGPKTNSIVHVLYLYYGPQRACDFLTAVQNVTDAWGTSHGFSIGMSDCIPTSYEAVDKLLESTEVECELVLSRYTDPDERERKMMVVLNNASNKAQLLAAKIASKGDKNALDVMRSAGSKGNIINGMQIMTAVGQQAFSGKRLPCFLTGGRRSYYYFKPDDHGPAARGFVKNNYVRGLTPTEVFAHAGAGRDGLASTGLRTADSGYLHKKMARKLEDLRTCSDGTVRDSSGRVVQFLYGGDGLNARWITNVPGMNRPFFVNVEYVATRLRAASPSSPVRHLTEDEVTELTQALVIGDGEAVNGMPIRTATYHLRSALRTALETVLVPDHEVTKFIQSLYDLFERSKVCDGHMAGLETTSAIGEPSTQMTLNVFHSTGVGSKDVTMGIPRLTEILNATKKPSKPNSTVYIADLEYQLSVLALRHAAKSSEDTIRSLKKACLEGLMKYRYIVERLTIGKLLSKVEYHTADPSAYDALPKWLHTDFIKDITCNDPDWWTEEWCRLTETDIPESGPWVIRLYFNLGKLYESRITLSSIIETIKEHVGEDKCQCIPSPLAYGIIDVYATDAAAALIIDKLDLDGSDNELISADNIAFFTARDVTVPYIEAIPIAGVEGADKVRYYEDEKGEWCLDVALGKRYSFLEILAIPEVDKKRTVINDIWEIYETLGIEAVRSFLIGEITRIISFDGTYVNPRHIALLVDSMLHSGEVTAVRREGIGRDVGPIAKGMFERALASFVESGVFAEHDDISGVAACVAVGIPFKGGTGSVKVVASDAPLRGVVPQPPPVSSDQPKGGAPKRPILGEVVERQPLALPTRGESASIATLFGK